MKKVFYILVIFVMSAFVACKKDKTDNGLAQDLIGSWELAATSASITPTVSHPPGQGNFLSFNDNKYFIYENHELVKEGSYTVVIDTTHSENVCLTSPGGEFARRIIFDNDGSANKTFFNVAAHKLVLRSGCFAVDAGVEKVYNRVFAH
ncbi:hypothetical protein [Longitalea luteola]|uniref:hypothetical protein n=1 Tax=Longitalea luteola TaxID=2812563 RepID=UPI001A957AEC|nr:hypothetical protein [Longitalea luteola]